MNIEQKILSQLSSDEVKIAQRTHELWEHTKEYFGLQDEGLTAVFCSNRAMRNMFPKGKHVVGLASREDGANKVKYNRYAIAQSFGYVYREVIPHELAHIVCFCRPELGKGHDDGWKDVCRYLGGEPTRRVVGENIDLRLRIRKRYEYNVDGTVFTVTDYKHKDIQRGMKFVVKSSGALVLPKHFTGEIK